MASSTTNRLSEYLPLLAFVAAWALQLAYFLGFDSRIFFTYGFSVIFIIVAAIAAYVGGFLAVRLLPLAQWFAGPTQVRSVPDARTATVLMQITLVLAAGLITLNILLPLSRGISLSGARELALEGWERGDFFPRILAVAANFTMAFSLMTVIDRIDVRGKFPIFLTIVFVLLTIAAYSRAHLLLGFSIISTKWISQSKYRLPYIISAFALFAALFSILSMIASVGSADRAGGVEDALSSLEVYTFGGVAGFEFYYNTGFPQYNSILTVPRFMYSIIPGIGALPPSYFPFIDTVPPINVFSALYPPYHDFGQIGVIVFFAIYGMMSALVARRFERKPGRLMCVLSGFLLYAALMSPFDDQYIRGLTVLILMLSGLVLYSLLYRLLQSGLFSLR